MQPQELLENPSPLWMATLALGAPLTLLLASGLYPSSPRRPASLIAWAAGLGPVVAIGLAVGVGLWGPMTSPLLGAAELGASLRFDALSVTIFGMVALLSVVILRFSATYLEGDARRGIFLSRMCRTIAAVEVLVLSGNVVLFAAAWISTSVSLHTLLLFHPERPAAVAAARKKFIAARIGDVCLLLAAGLLYQSVGSGQLDVIFARAANVAGSGAIELAAALLAVAALFKSAQFPTHGWLVEVMETPTPVSALLHAGILNAGPFLVIRFAAVMELGFTASVFLVIGGGFTALFASVVLLTQPSVKVALGYSSAAHMGFMLLICGLGVYPAAVLHLVAHSFYKAHAFLSSGSVVELARASSVPVPERRKSPVRMLAGFAGALALYAGLAFLLGFSVEEQPALLLVGAILVLGLTQILAPAFDSKGTLAGLAGALAIATVTTLAFFGLEEGARRLLFDVLPAPEGSDPIIFGLSLLVLLGFATAIALQVVASSAGSPLRQRAYVLTRNGFYANAMIDRMVGAYRLRAPTSR
jgi:NAD(P)H-quinone oxidoreductase subunit 5